MSRFQLSHRWLTALAVLGSALAFAPRAVAQTYKIDDGTAGYALSYAYPEDLCWLNHLTVNGTVTLTSIEAVFGSVPNGRPVHLCIWRDLSGVGDPNTGLLLTRVDTVVKNAGTQMLTEYAIPPTQVTGSFFVGAFLTTNGSFSPATLDPHTPTLARSWFCTAYGPGTFDPTFLGNWSLYSVTTIGVQGVFMLRANGIDGPTPEVRCVAKVNSLGCTPSLSLAGTPSASAGSGFTITASNVFNQKNGMFFYSLTGLQMAPFFGGHLCINAPLHRTSVFSSAGNTLGDDCSGSYTFDFNTRIASGLDPALTAGTTVDGQFWSRDPGFAQPNNIGLTQAAHFGIAP
jgi:hypothetical protein